MVTIKRKVEAGAGLVREFSWMEKTQGSLFWIVLYKIFEKQKKLMEISFSMPKNLMEMTSEVESLIPENLSQFDKISVFSAGGASQDHTYGRMFSVDAILQKLKEKSQANFKIFLCGGEDLKGKIATPAFCNEILEDWKSLNWRQLGTSSVLLNGTSHEENISKFLDSIEGEYKKGGKHLIFLVPQNYAHSLRTLLVFQKIIESKSEKFDKNDFQIVVLPTFYGDPEFMGKWDFGWAVRELSEKGSLKRLLFFPELLREIIKFRITLFGLWESGKGFKVPENLQPK